VALYLPGESAGAGAGVRAATDALYHPRHKAICLILSTAEPYGAWDW
jgi:hypothetical protein